MYYIAIDIHTYISMYIPMVMNKQKRQHVQYSAFIPF